MGMDVAGSRVEFGAPWGLALRVLSLVSCGLLVGLAVIFGSMESAPAVARVVAGVGMPALLLGCALFTVRGYVIQGRTLWVKRLFWDSCIPLDGLSEASADPSVLKRSIRIAGNGGVFSFSGWFWNRTLGRFRAYATDIDRAVALRWPGRAVVVSPDSPERFISTLREMRLVS